MMRTAKCGEGLTSINPATGVSCTKMSTITRACGLGEAVHTAFRKATDCEQAKNVWLLIREMSDEEWNAVLEYIYDCMPDRVQTAMEAEAVAKREL